VDPLTVDVALGPNYRLLAVSDFTTVPGPGVAVVDVSGSGYILTQALWMDETRHAGDGWFDHSGTGSTVAYDAVYVTGHVEGSCSVLTGEVRGHRWTEHFEFEVTPTVDGWYAGCRPIPEEWLDDDDFDIGAVEVRLIQR
jgi:hypothetical protein